MNVKPEVERFRKSVFLAFAIYFEIFSKTCWVDRLLDWEQEGRMCTHTHTQHTVQSSSGSRL